MAGEVIYVPILLGLGLKELSANPQAIPFIKNAIRLLNLEQTRKFVDELLKQNTVEEIERLMQSTYGDLLTNGLYKHWEQ
jgi:phosphotransferase system enzyme I (PtsI)